MRKRKDEPNIRIATHIFSVNLFIGCDAKTPTIGKRRPIMENKTRTAIEEPLKGNEENKRVDRVTEY